MTKVAVCQIRSTADPEHNLRVSSSVIREAAKAGAVACFLPEAADFIVKATEECRRLSLPLSRHGYTLGLQELAKELGVSISVGVHDVPEDGQDDEPDSLRVFNTHVLIDKDGSIKAKYSKLHLYDVELIQDGRVKRIGESDRVRPGQSIVAPADVEGFKVGLEICYDLRFPELSIILARMGADVLTFPSAFMLPTGKAHWATLLRAAAIQYQVYVLAAAQYGAHHASRSSWGESLAFDPWGRELGRLRSVEEPGGDYDGSGEFFLCDIDHDVINETRKQIPLAIQKRADMYGVVGERGPE
ncbi:carbon-nitrogen hydrolase [Cutaneotrichosporon oleaginosum]|uniref:Carbon-nitrogen hydrolase n=1 Tax=Cutaneotrichosporon oleaginosum TaxID=879819 RepID=A0A0J0XKW9_9TREE|nr:carbon-nitrogen hydrolase [Cutaneotrichosporon oleaginosum]KLT41725.1 carbon-nitrogen hydrolase [Cutaneotrichosporon oleaginosum]